MNRFVIQYSLEGRWIDSMHSYRSLRKANQHKGAGILTKRVYDTKRNRFYPNQYAI